jgi:hypothetical protein
MVQKTFVAVVAPISRRMLFPEHKKTYNPGYPRTKWRPRRSRTLVLMPLHSLILPEEMP